MKLFAGFQIIIGFMCLLSGLESFSLGNNLHGLIDLAFGAANLYFGHQNWK